MKKVVEYWEVYRYGGGVYPNKPLGNFSREDVAEKASIGQGKGGSDAKVKHRVVEIYDTIEDRDEAFLEQEKLAILKKLSPRERHVLGFGNVELGETSGN